MPWLLLRSVAAIACLAVLSAEPATLHPLRVNGPASNQINLVFLSEGFTADQLPEFPGYVNTLLYKLFQIDPFSSYQSYFNAYAVTVASAESGSDHPSRGVFRNTYFNSSFDSYGLARALTVPPNGFDPDPEHGFGKAHRLLAGLLPGWSVIIFVVNDEEHGGWGDRKGVVISRNWFSSDTLIHELGHAFGGLGDEYDTAFPEDPDPVVEEPNTTRETRRELTKWKAWIEDSTPIPTPNDVAYLLQVGLFEGARYSKTGWYRPKLSCIMRQSYATFCEVCREALILAAYRFASPVEASFPENPVIELGGDEEIELGVNTKQPADYGLTVAWWVDGALAVADSPRFVLHSTALGDGVHQVQARVRDGTDKVRTDPEGLLEETREWTVHVSGAGLAPSRSRPRPEHPTRRWRP